MHKGPRGDIEDKLGFMTMPPTECPIPPEEFTNIQESLKNRGVKVDGIFKYWHGLLGTCFGDASKLKVEAIMVPATPLLQILKSKVMDAIRKRVGDGFEAICSKIVAHYPWGGEVPDWNGIANQARPGNARTFRARFLRLGQQDIKPYDEPRKRARKIRVRFLRPG